MKLKLKIASLNYGDAAILMLPKLREKAMDDSAVSRIVRAVTELPEPVVYSLFDAIPEAEKNGIVAALAAENEDRILHLLQDFMAEHGLGISVARVRITENLYAEVTIPHIDFPKLAEKLLPKLQNAEALGGIAGSVLSMLTAVPKPLWIGVIKAIPEEKILNTCVTLLNCSSDSICKALETYLQKAGIRARVESLTASL